MQSTWINGEEISNHPKIAKGPICEVKIEIEEIEILKDGKADFIYVNDSENCDDLISDGVIGLGPKLTNNETTSFMHYLNETHKIEQLTYSIFLGDKRNQDSFISLGEEVDTTNKSQPLTINNTSEDEWIIQIDKLCYGDTEICVNTTVYNKTILSTSFPALGIPSDYLKPFLEDIAKEKGSELKPVNGTKFYKLNCKSFDDFEGLYIVISNDTGSNYTESKNITISPHEYMIVVNDNCAFYIFPTLNNHILFGIPAMKGVLTTYDLENNTVTIYDQVQYEYHEEKYSNKKWIIVLILYLIVYSDSTI